MTDEITPSPSNKDVLGQSLLGETTTTASSSQEGITDSKQNTETETAKKKNKTKKKKTKKQPVTKDKGKSSVSLDETTEEDLGVVIAVTSTGDEDKPTLASQVVDDNDAGSSALATTKKKAANKPKKKKSKKPKSTSLPDATSNDNEPETAAVATTATTSSEPEVVIEYSELVSTAKQQESTSLLLSTKESRREQRPDPPKSHRFEPPPAQFNVVKSKSKMRREKKATAKLQVKPSVNDNNDAEKSTAAAAPIQFVTTTPFDLIKSATHDEVLVDEENATTEKKGKKRSKATKAANKKKQAASEEKIVVESSEVISYEQLSTSKKVRNTVAATSSSHLAQGAARMAKRALQHSGISSRTTTTTTTTTATSMKSTDKSASGANKGNVRKQSSRRTLFTQHYSQDEVAAGLRSGQLVEGKLRVSQRSRSEAYVTVDGYEDYDIFIFGHSLRNRAMDGDTVAVALLTDQERKEAKKSKLNAEQQRRQRYGDGDVVGGGGSLNEPSLWGKVVGIVYSNTQRLFVGTLSKTRVTQDTSNNDDNNANTSASPVHWWFKPTDKLIPMMLVPNEQIPKQIQIVLNNTNAINNLLFTVKVTRWPLSHMNPLAQVVDLLGSPGQLETETKMLLINAQVRLAPFPQALLNSLPSLPWSIPDTELANRYDMRSFSVFTVDPATAKDLDDAISCTRNENGNYSIGVHIADVSHFVLPQTALDDEAQKRATTTYLVDKAIPMLPPLLCEQLCSLQPGVDRLAFSVIWHMTPEGKILDTWFGRTIIRSCCQLSYEHAQMAIEGNELPDDIKIDKSHSATQIAEDIRLFHKLAQGLRKQRYENGAVSIHSVKLSFDLDDQGSPIDCRVYERKESHFMIEEFMLLANISVAKRIAVTFPEQALLRRHAPPIARRMESFTELSQQLGYDIDGSSSSSLQESLASIKDPEIAHVLCCLCVKSMRRARYFCTGALDITQYHHYALNAPLYTHFTSPIRRYADLIVHRLLAASITSNPSKNGSASNSQPAKSMPTWLREANPVKEYSLSTEKMRQLARQCNYGKDRAKKAQDASSMLYLALYLDRLVGQTTRGLLRKDAIILEVLDRSVRVSIMEYDIEQRVYLKWLPLHRSIWNEASQTQTLWWKSDAVITPQYVKSVLAGQSISDTTKESNKNEENTDTIDIVDPLDNVVDDIDDAVRFVTDREEDIVDPLALIHEASKEEAEVEEVKKEVEEKKVEEVETAVPESYGQPQVLRVFTKVSVWIMVDKTTSPPDIKMLLANPFE